MNKICTVFSLMKVKHDKLKSEAIEEHRELLRLAEIGKRTEESQEKRYCKRCEREIPKNNQSELCAPCYEFERLF